HPTGATRGMRHRQHTGRPRRMRGAAGRQQAVAGTVRRGGQTSHPVDRRHGRTGDATAVSAPPPSGAGPARTRTSHPADGSIGMTTEARSARPIAGEYEADDVVAVAMTVNGTAVEAKVPARMLLSDFLRHELRLTGTH